MSSEKGHNLLFEFRRMPVREQNERFMLLTEICSSVEFLNSYHITSFISKTPLEAVRLSAPMLKNACEHLAQESDAGFGYKIHLSDRFLYDNYVAFPGLFLVLSHEDKGQVGVMQIQVGIPFIVVGVQGEKGQGPLEFHRKAGRPFYEALLGRLNHCAGANMRFRGVAPLEGMPKVALKIWDGRTPQPIINGLSKYLHKSEAPRFRDFKAGAYAVRPKFVSPHRAGSAKAALIQKA